MNNQSVALTTSGASDQAVTQTSVGPRYPPQPLTLMTDAAAPCRSSLAASGGRLLVAGREIGPPATRSPRRPWQPVCGGKSEPG